MRWSVSFEASGDRELEIEEIVELADAVAVHSGIASGIGTSTYGAQIVVEAESHDEAVQLGTSLFHEAAATAGLPAWPLSAAWAISEADEEAEADAGEEAAAWTSGTFEHSVERR